MKVRVRNTSSVAYRDTFPSRGRLLLREKLCSKGRQLNITQMKYAFFIDIDGTLTYGSGIPEENIKAMKKAREKGHLMLLNTGRGLRFIPRFVLKDAPLDGIVAGSGSYCSLGDRVLKAERIPKDELKAAAAFLFENGKKFLLEGENIMLCGNRHIDAEGFYDITDADELDAKYSHAIIEKINISGVLSKEQSGFLAGMFNLWQHSDYAECAIKDCDKGAAMKYVMTALPEGFKSVAVGDSINDVDMLKAADISVAMGNSSQQIKDMCNIVTASNGEAGLGRIIEKLTTNE